MSHPIISGTLAGGGYQEAQIKRKNSFYSITSNAEQGHTRIKFQVNISNKVQVEKMQGSKGILGINNLSSKKIWGQPNFWSNKFFGPKKMSQKNFGSKKSGPKEFGKKDSGGKNLVLKIFLVYINFG